MKKVLILVAAIFTMTSCTTILKTAQTQDVPVLINTSTAADLDISAERVTYTLAPEKSIRKGGLQNVKEAAVQEVLQANGNADVLVDPMYVVKKGGVMGKIRSVTVSGRPAKYKNFRSMKK